MMEKLKNKKIQYTLTFGAVAAAVLLFQGIMPNKPPKIIDISPNQGYPGIMVTIIGSGFTKQSDNVSETRINGQKLDPGNYIKILGEVQNSHAFSQDGVTLKIKLDLNTNRVVQECIKRVNQNKSCEVGIKVVNAYGVESNEFHYLVINRPPPLHASYEVIPLSPENPILSKGSNETKVFLYKITADPKNDAPIYVLAGTSVYAKSVDGSPMDCSNLFNRNWVILAGEPSTFGGQSNFIGGISQTGWCSGVPFYTGFLTINPGEQQTFSVLAAASPNAQAGLQFRLIVGNLVNSIESPDPGSRDVFISNSSGSDWLDGGGEWSNVITIAP